MLDYFLDLFSHHLGIDLGTANTLIYIKDKGVVLNEPSAIALNKKSGQILAVGTEAKEMLGKTPPNITALRPLKNGVVSDLEACEKMLDYFIRKVHTLPSGMPKIPRPLAVIAVPSGITEVEQRAVFKAANSAGVRKVYLIEEPIAAAIGAGIDINTPSGNMIVDIGGGTTEIAVISLGGIVVNKSLRAAGDKMDEDIINYMKNKFNVLLGDKGSEEAKMHGVNLWIEDIKEDPKKTFEVRGRNLKTGLPEVIKIKPTELNEALKVTVDLIIDSIKQALEDTPPELISDIYKNGIYVTGGGSKLHGLNKLILNRTGIPVHVPEEPELSVVKGAGALLEDKKLLDLVRI
jgi:rod shape-determining protein MreB and related proteins